MSRPIAPYVFLIVLAFAVTLAVGAIVHAVWTPSSGADAAQVAQGRELYVQHCASCHGGNLEGQPNWRERLPSGRMPAPPHDETGHTWHHPDAVLFGITREGLTGTRYAPKGYESDMPGFGHQLTDAEIRAVLAYIKSTWPPRILEYQREIERQSRGQR